MNEFQLSLFIYHLDECISLRPGLLAPPLPSYLPSSILGSYLSQQPWRQDNFLRLHKTLCGSLLPTGWKLSSFWLAFSKSGDLAPVFFTSSLSLSFPLSMPQSLSLGCTPTWKFSFTSELLHFLRNPAQTSCLPTISLGREDQTTSVPHRPCAGLCPRTGFLLMGTDHLLSHLSTGILISCPSSALTAPLCEILILTPGAVYHH